MHLKMEKYVNLPIILVTSEAAKYNVLETIKAGVSDYIRKPISGVTVLRKYKSISSRREKCRSSIFSR